MIAGYVVLALLVALVGVVAGLGALLGAATITDQPPLFLLAGFLAFCVAYLLGLLLVTRNIILSMTSTTVAMRWLLSTLRLLRPTARAVLADGEHPGGRWTVGAAWPSQLQEDRCRVVRVVALQHACVHPVH